MNYLDNRFRFVYRNGLSPKVPDAFSQKKEKEQSKQAEAEKIDTDDLLKQSSDELRLNLNTFNADQLEKTSAKLKENIEYLSEQESEETLLLTRKVERLGERVEKIARTTVKQVFEDLKKSDKNLRLEKYKIDFDVISPRLGFALLKQLVALSQEVDGDSMYGNSTDFSNNGAVESFLDYTAEYRKFIAFSGLNFTETEEDELNWGLQSSFYAELSDFLGYVESAYPDIFANLKNGLVQQVIEHEKAQDSLKSMEVTPLDIGENPYELSEAELSKYNKIRTLFSESFLAEIGIDIDSINTTNAVDFCIDMTSAVGLRIMGDLAKPVKITEVTAMKDYYLDNSPDLTNNMYETFWHQAAKRDVDNSNFISGDDKKLSPEWQLINEIEKIGSTDNHGSEESKSFVKHKLSFVLPTLNKAVDYYFKKNDLNADNSAFYRALNSIRA